MIDHNEIVESVELKWAEIEAYESRARALRSEAMIYGFNAIKSFIVKSVMNFWQHWIVDPRAVASETAAAHRNLHLHAPERPEIFGATNA